ncbi:MAG: ISKra4 family transposase [Candidatus Eisenbacteria sp.]|nr:ISKra4 family transposase [Candidatus Eisenbacteria bacterium]
MEALVGPGTVGDWDFEAIETAARYKALSVAARAVEWRLNADTSDYAGSTLPCACGQCARYAGRHNKTFESVLGSLTLSRAYYHCAVCETGFCPRDSALGLQGGSLTPGVLRMVGLVGATVSFEEGHELLTELAGVDVPTKHVERAAEALGREIAQDERRVVETPAANEAVAPTLYLGMDGTGVPVRKEELVNRPGKQPDGTAKTREVKLVTVWSAEGRDEEGKPVRDKGSISYSAAIESAATRDTDEHPAEFVQRVVREATRRGFEQAGRRVVLGDGALWIWNLADEHFPGAIEIVDLYHAKGHLWDVAKAIYGAGSDLAERWAKKRRDELDEGKIDDILAALGLHIDVNDEARKCFDYVTRNRHRMRYPEFRAQGLCVGSGVVEAGCKTAIGVRCKRAGMHWTVAGADAIIALRCCKLSGRFEDFWERRSASRDASG